MRDLVVINSLKQRGFDFGDIEESLVYETIERKKRILDGPPKRISLTSYEVDSEIGVKQEFILLYTEMKKEILGDTFILDLGHSKKYYDYEVYTVLQTLFRMSISYSQEIAVACFDIFKTLGVNEYDIVTKERAYELVLGIVTKDYYKSQIISGIMFSLYGKDTMGVYWKSIAKFNGIYKNAYMKGVEFVSKNYKTEKELNVALKEEYKKAKEDKEFLSKIYEKGLSKEMLAMVYMLRNEEGCLED